MFDLKDKVSFLTSALRTIISAQKKDGRKIVAIVMLLTSTTFKRGKKVYIRKL